MKIEAWKKGKQVEIGEVGAGVSWEGGLDFVNVVIPKNVAAIQKNSLISHNSMLDNSDLAAYFNGRNG
jgi:hypothetical protein